MVMALRLGRKLQPTPQLGNLPAFESRCSQHLFTPAEPGFLFFIALCQPFVTLVQNFSYISLDTGSTMEPQHKSCFIGML